MCIGEARGWPRPWIFKISLLTVGLKEEIIFKLKSNLVTGPPKILNEKKYIRIPDGA